MSCVELTERVLERLRTTEPSVHAYVCERGKAALEEARAADRRRRRGEAVSPLDGVPFAVKDVIATQDLPTEGGARLLSGHRPARDAAAVARTRYAGAILVGKHVTHQFAMRQDFPPTRNPWNLEHYPGGSSAGGGVSIAVGSALFALGTDAGGSVRKPAALTGTVGLKPTYGLIATEGVLSLATAESLDHVGIITRTAADTAVVLCVLADDRFGQPNGARIGSSLEANLEAGPLSGVRVGVERSYFNRCSTEIEQRFQEAIGVLAGLGAEIVDITLPLMELTLAVIFPILLSEVGVKHAALLTSHAEQYEPATRTALQTGALIPATWTSRARLARERIRRQVADVFTEASLSVLATPTVPRTSMPLTDMDVSRDLPELVRFTAPWNLTGQPAITVPCGLTPAGLPVGLQLVGKPWHDREVIEIARAYQSATKWHELEPPMPLIPLLFLPQNART